MKNFNLGLHIPIWNCDVNVIVKVNIACALRWGVAFIGITLQGVTHPIWDNISSAGNASVAVLIQSRESEEIWLVAL